MGLKSKFTQGAAGAEDAAAAQAAANIGPPRFAYKVETIRSKLIGDKMHGGDVETLLNQRAAEGWGLKSMVETEVKGRVGPGGTMGLMLVFERPLG
jgi:hypothetical protein